MTDLARFHWHYAASRLVIRPSGAATTSVAFTGEVAGILVDTIAAAESEGRDAGEFLAGLFTGALVAARGEAHIREGEALAND